MSSASVGRKNSGLKTYSRRVNSSTEEPPTKKRRIEEHAKVELPAPKPQIKRSSIQNWFKPIPPPSSSPLPSPLPSSDAAEPTSTPPSSPPAIRSSSPIYSKPAKKRRLTTRPALQTIENAARPERSKESSAKLSQMRLDLGQQVYEECSTCHYYFDRSDESDRKEHDKFHNFHTDNVQPKTEDPKVVLWQQNVDGKHHSIRAISRTSPMALREGFLAAFSATYQDMGGEGIDDLQLWSEIKNPHDTGDGGKIPRYKGYMYLIDRHPVCILLVERIKSAIYFPFKDAVELDEARSKPQDACKMSVDRIWTRTSHRRKGYATRLVGMARSTFISGLELGKKDVAFTSTTMDGGRFAKAYCEGVFDEAEYLMTLS